MASIAKKISRAVSKGSAAATRAAVNPLYMVTDKVADKVIPGYGSKVTNVLVNTADPFSKTNEGLTKAAVKSLNPLKTVDAIKQAAGALTSATGTPKTSTAAKVVPDRESYSAAASSAESERARIMAQRLAEQKAAQTVPDRESYSISASTSEAIRNIAKQSAEQKAAQAEQTNAVQQATGTDSTSSAQYNASAASPGEIRIILDAGNAAREAALMEQQLPEVVIQSDYKKYFIIGGLALAAFYIFKKMK